MVIKLYRIFVLDHTVLKPFFDLFGSIYFGHWGE